MAKQHTFDYDLIVIGSGAGGSAAATIAARAGKRVAIIEAGVFGGEGNIYRTKRGAEKVIIMATIVIAALFFVVAIFNAYR